MTQTTETPGTATGAPQQPQKTPQGMPAPMEEAQRLLAGLEAEIRGGETALARTLHDGHEHFRAGMEKATAGLQDANLDNWTHQATAMARIGSAAGRTKPPAPEAESEES